MKINYQAIEARLTGNALNIETYKLEPKYRSDGDLSGSTSMATVCNIRFSPNDLLSKEIDNIFILTLENNLVVFQEITNGNVECISGVPFLVHKAYNSYVEWKAAQSIMTEFFDDLLI